MKFSIVIILLLHKIYSLENEYIISSGKCKIPDIQPFNDDTSFIYRPENYTSCSNFTLLTYINKINNTVYLHIRDDLIFLYSKNGINCCFSNVTRKTTPRYPDFGVRISKCKSFEKEVQIKSNIIMVKCWDRKTSVLVYENVHNILMLTEKVKTKLSLNPKAISVLFVVIDSVSRLNLIRTMPKTRSFLRKSNFLEFKGYNKINDNTFPNFMAFLTGFNLTQSYKLCNPVEIGRLDDCPMIWYDYRALGYATAYAEDHANISTFNFLKAGFEKPPTDYYFKPYIEASEKLFIKVKDGMPYCTGPESSGERILNLARNFSITFKNLPSFGIFWMNTFSHNKINSPSGMDEKFTDFFSDLQREGIFNKSIVVFISDHGIRFGNIRLTRSGWFEERLPFLLMSIPDWFKTNFPNEYKNFMDNSNKLTTPYDLYMTLQHILVLSGFQYESNYASSCHKCKSLFKNIPEKRSCEDAAIPPEWCTCIGDLKPINATHKYVVDAINFVLTRVRNVLEAKVPGKCAEYKLDSIISSSLSENLDYNRNRVMYITFSTKPEAVFLVTIKFRKFIENTSVFQLVRFDDYSQHSNCVLGTEKKLCHCI